MFYLKGSTTHAFSFTTLYIVVCFNSTKAGSRCTCSTNETKGSKGRFLKSKIQTITAANQLNDSCTVLRCNVQYTVVDVDHRRC